MTVRRDGHQDADTATYRSGLRRVLDAASPSVVRRLERVRDAATVRTDGVTIDVFPDQEGDGTFAVWARFRGEGVLFATVVEWIDPLMVAQNGGIRSRGGGSRPRWSGRRSRRGDGPSS
ncbi:DUF6389 family protein [Streptomyces parvus]